MIKIDKATEKISIDLELVKDFVERFQSGQVAEDITITVPKHRYPNKSIWLVTDKDGSSQLIMCSDKPLRKTDFWAPCNGDFLQADINSPSLAKFFGVFWEEAAEELKKIGLPKWEDDPVEIEISRIKINYY